MAIHCYKHIACHPGPKGCYYTYAEAVMAWPGAFSTSLVRIGVQGSGPPQQVSIRVCHTTSTPETSPSAESFLRSSVRATGPSETFLTTIAWNREFRPKHIDNRSLWGKI